jgi:hypothetical protein
VPQPTHGCRIPVAGLARPGPVRPGWVIGLAKSGLMLGESTHYGIKFAAHIFGQLSQLIGVNSSQSLGSVSHPNSKRFGADKAAHTASQSFCLACECGLIAFDMVGALL